MTTLIVSIILTLIILYLSLLTISKGYGYKHKIDPLKEHSHEDDNHRE